MLSSNRGWCYLPVGTAESSTERPKDSDPALVKSE